MLKKKEENVENIFKKSKYFIYLFFTDKSKGNFINSVVYLEYGYFMRYEQFITYLNCNLYVTATKLLDTCP